MQSFEKEKSLKKLNFAAKACAAQEAVLAKEKPGALYWDEP